MQYKELERMRSSSLHEERKIVERFDRNSYVRLKEAVSALAGVCDGAAQRDNHGFDGGDARAGHLFAFLPLDAWPLSAFHRAWQWSRKYHRQLEIMDIDCTDLAEPPPFAGRDYQIAYQPDKRAFLVVFPYEGALLETFTALPGARNHRVAIGEGRLDFWYRTVWVKARGAVPALLAFAEQYGFDLAPDVSALKVSPSRIVFAATPPDAFAVYFPHDAQLNEEIKRIPGRQTSFSGPFCWIIPATRLAARMLLAFVERHPQFMVEMDVRRRLQELCGERDQMQVKSAGLA